MEMIMNKSLLFAPLFVFALTASPVKADVIFGDTDPSPRCSPSARGVTGSMGHACAANESFGQVVAHGFSGAPAPGNGNMVLADKGAPGAPSDLQPENAFNESGLGIASDCTHDCEIVPPESVTVVATGSNKITDLVISSVQGNDTFNFFVEKAPGGPFSRIGGGPFSDTCSGSPAMSIGPVAATCLWSNAAGVSGVAVEAHSGDMAIAEVSGYAGVPEPGSFALLGMGLLALGYRSRRHRPGV